MRRPILLGVVLAVSALVLSGLFLVQVRSNPWNSQIQGSTSDVGESPAMVKMFLKIDGIPGESTDAKHKNEIEILSYSWSEYQPAGGGAGGGIGAGRVDMKDFKFTMGYSKASPKLFLACARGEHIKSAVLTVLLAREVQVEFLKWTFSDVLVTSYQTNCSGDWPLDQITINFSKIEVEYKELDEMGNVKGTTKAYWDLKSNKGS